MALLQVSGPLGERFNLPANNDGPLDVILVDPTTLPAGVVSPFRGTFYVDPLFVGTQNGSQSNPFTTVAAAFAAALAQALVAAVVFLAPGSTINENVVFPPTGADWEISSTEDGYLGGGVGSIINGTVTCDSTAAAVAYRLKNVVVVGAVSGTAAAASTSFLFLTQVRTQSTVTLANSGGASTCQAFLEGIGTADSTGSSGRIGGALSIAGRIIAANYLLFGAVTEATPNGNSRYTGCLFNVPNFTLNGFAGQTVLFNECSFLAALTFTSPTSKNLAMGPVSMASALQLGMTFAGGPFSASSAVAQRAITGTVLLGNLAPTAVTGSPAPAGLYEAVGTLDLTTPGTAGTAQINVIYTDLNGVLQTKPITGAGLLITGAVGTEAAGSLVFRHNGATAIQYSVTGVVTPGALVMNAAIAVMKRD